MAYVHELRGWPTLTWHEGELSSLLANVRHKQGKLLGRTEDLGCDLRRERAALFNRRSQRSDFTYHVTYHAGMAQGLFRPFPVFFDTTLKRGFWAILEVFLGLPRTISRR